MILIHVPFVSQIKKYRLFIKISINYKTSHNNKSQKKESKLRNYTDKYIRDRKKKDIQTLYILLKKLFF